MKILSLAIALLSARPAQAPAPASLRPRPRHRRPPASPAWPPSPAAPTSCRPASRRSREPSGSGPSSCSRPARPGCSTSRPNGGSILVTTRFGQSMQLHVVDRAMGARTQITFGREPVTSGAFQPGDPMVVYFRRDVGGSENWQIYRLDRRTGRTDLPHRRQEPARGARALRPTAAASPTTAPGATARTPTSTWPRRHAPARPAASSRPRGPGSRSTSRATATQLLVRRYRSIADSDLFLVDVATGARRALTPAAGKASVGAARFSADGKLGLPRHRPAGRLRASSTGSTCPTRRRRPARSPARCAGTSRGWRWRGTDPALHSR